ncbi:MAG: methyltransferase domain-containing protein [Acidobacteria bacterium]|nr:methyltransferase domain-containing protein [Acidobacteriota bacterium]
MDARELAFLYDLYVVPGWREVFDRIIDDEVKVPSEGKILDAGCGTGGFTIDLALLAGNKSEVVGLDPDSERLNLARAKAEIKKTTSLKFVSGELFPLQFSDGEFDFVIADATLLHPGEVPQFMQELTRVARKGATIVLKIATRGTFDEFYSVYWEALYNLGLTELSPKLEELITERYTLSEIEQIAIDAGHKHIHVISRNERLNFDDAASFFQSPMIQTLFLSDWLKLIETTPSRQKVQSEMADIIDNARNGLDFDLSIKATVIVARK